MKKNTFYSFIILFYLSSTTHLFASVDDALRKNKFINITFESFVKSLEEEFQVKIDVHGGIDGQNIVILGNNCTIRDSFAHFFKINNIKNSSFVSDSKDNLVRVWILSEYDDKRKDSARGKLKGDAGKMQSQIEDDDLEVESGFDPYVNPRAEFTDEEIEQLEGDRQVYEDPGMIPREAFSEEELEQFEGTRLRLEHSDSLPKSEFAEEELKQLEEVNFSNSN